MLLRNEANLLGLGLPVYGRPRMDQDDELVLTMKYQSDLVEVRDRKFKEAFFNLFFNAEDKLALAFTDAIEALINAKAEQNPGFDREEYSVSLRFNSSKPEDAENVKLKPKKNRSLFKTNKDIIAKHELEKLKKQLEKMPDVIDKHLAAKGEFDLMTRNHP